MPRPEVRDMQLERSIRGLERDQTPLIISFKLETIKEIERITVVRRSWVIQQYDKPALGNELSSSTVRVEVQGMESAGDQVISEAVPVDVLVTCFPPLKKAFAILDKQYWDCNLIGSIILPRPDFEAKLRLNEALARADPYDKIRHALLSADSACGQGERIRGVAQEIWLCLS